jgi:transketolase
MGTDIMNTDPELAKTIKERNEQAAMSKELDQLCVNTLRFLSVDMVEKAKSGHPGLPLGAAPMVYTLYDRILRYNPENPNWFNRDRFILSAGHGCALLYSVFHLTGYELPLEELKRFRQWESMTPGHPEYGHTPGVEATTGPLGQGFAMGVGMAIAEEFLRAHFNKPEFPIIDHYVYSLVSDGDLMEGIASEAASLAGHLGLGRIIYMYDNNKVSLDGSTDISFTEDVGERFEAYGWHVVDIPDGNDLDAIESALSKAQFEKNRPSLIMVRTHIGYGSPKQDTSKAHGEPLGDEATRATKTKLGWPLEPSFYIPEDALDHFRHAIDRGRQMESEWDNLLERYQKKYPELAAQLDLVMNGTFPNGWDADLPKFKSNQGPLATRDASSKVMNALAKKLPTFMGGSADLASSTKTDLKEVADFSMQNREGRNIRFGVREHAMGAIANGMYQHGGVIPYTGTFLTFSDYMRPAMRIACLMNAGVTFIFSHDSIALGEDGPTHQPIDQITSLRAIPNMTIYRPADANESTVAWRLALERKRPASILLTRQKLPVMNYEEYPIFEGAPHGGYILADAKSSKPDIILIATGSEVQLILGAREKLTHEGIAARAVSMISQEIFDEQPPEYRHEILPHGIPVLAVEAGIPDTWYKYIGGKGDVIGLDRFGVSAPGNVVMENLGFTVDNVVKRALKLLGKRS